LDPAEMVWAGLRGRPPGGDGGQTCLGAVAFLLGNAQVSQEKKQSNHFNHKRDKAL